MPDHVQEAAQEAPKREEPPKPEPTEAEKKAAEKARLKLAQRMEQERRDELGELLELHSLVSSKLEAAEQALSAASAASEELQRRLGRSRLSREVSLGRRLRVDEVVRTAGAARHHVSRLSKGAAAVGKAVRESMDELVRPDPGPAFE